MGDFYEFLKAFFKNWFLYMTAGPFLLDEILGRLWPNLRLKLGRVIPPKRRRQIEIAILLFGVFYAGFAAFKEERNALVAARRQPQTSSEITVNEKDPTGTRRTCNYKDEAGGGIC